MQRSKASAATPAAATANDLVVMGQVLAPYGVAGWIKVRPYTRAPDALLTYRSWWLRPAGGAGDWQSMARIDGRLHANTVLARLAGVETREAAAALKGCDIGVPRAAMPAAGSDEIYWADLIGLDVVNREGVALGRVAGVTAHGAHPLLRVAHGNREKDERLIPYVPAYVDRVDLAARTIVVDWGIDF